MSPWWLCLGLLSWCPTFKSSHCNSFEDRVTDLQMSCSDLTRMVGYQDSRTCHGQTNTSREITLVYVCHAEKGWRGPWASPQYKDRLSQVLGIPMLKIRRSWDRLIFNMGIPILVRRHLYIETVPVSPYRIFVFERFMFVCQAAKLSLPQCVCIEILYILLSWTHVNKPSIVQFR